MLFLKFAALLLIAASIAALSPSVNAQRPRFADPFQNQSGNFGPSGGIGFPSVGLGVAPQALPQGRLPQVQLPQIPSPQIPQLLPPNFSAPNFPPGAFPQPPQGIVTLPTLDPRPLFPGRDPSNYQLQPFPIFPNPANLPRFNTPPPVLPRAPQFQQPPGIGFPNAQAFSRPPNQQPQFNLGNGFPLQNRPPPEPLIDLTFARQQWQRFNNEFLPRVFERPRIRQTYLHGSNRSGVDGNELDINDIEFATTLTVPNFLQSRQPLRISPGFIASFWDGPETSSTGFDLPARAFGAYLGFDHVTDLSRTSGVESNFTVGVYSDYENFSSDAIRLTGRILGWQRVNEYTVAKLGVEYLDRVRVKLLPAVGVFLSPNPDIKFDLYFPRTKLAHRIPNVGNFEMWSYVGGEYGGGSWAIERIDGSDDQVDINDVRAFVGIEWIGPRGVTGFLDFGYAFNRELVFKSDSINELELQDTLLIRSGVAF